MGRDRDRPLRYDCRLPGDQGSSAKADHAESAKVRSDLNWHRPVLSLACVRADDNRYADECEHLPQELDVLHSLTVLDCDQYHAEPHGCQAKHELGSPTWPHCRHKDPKEA